MSHETRPHGTADDDVLSWAAARIADLARGRVCDLGCGEGRFLDAHALPFADASFDTVLANRMLNAAGRVDAVLTEIRRVLRPDGRLIVLTRARRREDADRLDPDNGAARLGAHFARVDAERQAGAALFVAGGAIDE